MTGRSPTPPPQPDGAPVIGASGRWRPSAWVCVLVFIAIAFASRALFDVSWHAIFVVVLLACPVVAILAYFTGMRPLPIPIGPVPTTRGRTLNWVAPYYDRICRVFGLGSAFRQRTVAIARLHPGEAVLDVGCGTGVLTRLAANAVGPAGHVWGIDPAPDMIRLAQTTAASGNKAQFRPGVIESLVFDDSSFDVVFISLVLHHLPPDLQRTGLKEACRVLKANGRVVVVDLDRPKSTIQQMLLSPLRMSERSAALIRGQMPELLREAGFAHVVPAGRWGMLGFWVAGKQPTLGPHENIGQVS